MKIYVFIVFLLFSLPVISCVEEVVDYVPLVKDGDGIREAPELETELHQKFAPSILTKCGYASKDDRGIYISISAKKNTTCIVNATLEIEAAVKSFENDLKPEFEIEIELPKIGAE